MAAVLAGVDGIRKSSWEAKAREIYLPQQVLLMMPLHRPIGINIEFGPLVAAVLGGFDGIRKSSWEAKEREIYLLQQVLLMMPLHRLYKYLRRISSVISSTSDWD